MKKREKPKLIACVAVVVVAATVAVLVLTGSPSRRPVAMLPNGAPAPAPVVNKNVQALDRREARSDVVAVQKALTRYRAQHGGFSGLTALTIVKTAPKASFQLMYAKARKVCAQIERGDQILHVTQAGAGPGVCPAQR